MEASHTYGQDLDVSAQGDLLLVGGVTATTQRLLRRLLTNQPDYIWQPDYGTGAGGYVGLAGVDSANLSALMVSECLKEPGVSASPAPVATITQNLDELDCSIVFYQQGNSEPQYLSFSIGG